VISASHTDKQTTLIVRAGAPARAGGTTMTWRQFRAQIVVTAAALAVLAVVLLITGPQLSHTFDTTVAGCRARGDCAGAINALQRPAVIGFFWGAPLLRGTGDRHVPALTALASVATAGLLRLMVSRWWSPPERVAADRNHAGEFSPRDLRRRSARHAVLDPAASLRAGPRRLGAQHGQRPPGGRRASRR
jgi:hypothetical protein